MACELLLHHAAIDHEDTTGATPIWVACRAAQEGVAQLLAQGIHHSHSGAVCRGADVDPIESLRTADVSTHAIPIAI